MPGFSRRVSKRSVGAKDLPRLFMYVAQNLGRRYGITICCCLMIYVFFGTRIYLAGHHYVAHVIQNPEHPLRSAHRFFDPKARASYSLAQAYYDDQRPLVLRSARKFFLKDYYAKLQDHVYSMDMTFYDLIQARLGLMGMWLKSKGWDDFKVEKDKCTMYSWIVLNGFPHVALHFDPATSKPWRDVDKFVTDMGSGKAFEGAKSWPVWIKACHLTQGSSESTRPIKSASEIADNIPAFDKWVKAKWIYEADDWERPWQAEGNLLTTGLEKGFILQESAVLTEDPIVGKRRIFELKVEVYWGHAYLAGLVDVGAGSLIMRWSNGTSMIELYDDVSDTFWHHGHKMAKDNWYHWIIDEGHVDCAFSLAERAARVMAIDEVRIDIFVTKGAPAECKINENSLSSGIIYGPQWGFMAKLWAEPYIRKEYKTFSLDGKRTYEQTADDIPTA